MHVGNKGVVCARAVILVKSTVIRPVNRAIEQLRIPTSVFPISTAGSSLSPRTLHQGVDELLVLRSEAFLGQFLLRQCLQPRNRSREALEMAHLAGLDRRECDQV